MSVWAVRGGTTNNFTQAADAAAAVPTDLAALSASYPPAVVEVVGMEHWVANDAVRSPLPPPPSTRAGPRSIRPTTHPGPWPPHAPTGAEARQ
eukprot:4595401-Prymnesium_polylepis.1